MQFLWYNQMNNLEHLILYSTQLIHCPKPKWLGWDDSQQSMWNQNLNMTLLSSSILWKSHLMHASIMSNLKQTIKTWPNRKLVYNFSIPIKPIKLLFALLYFQILKRQMMKMKIEDPTLLFLYNAYYIHWTMNYDFQI